jgi:hypothetical protein
MRPIKLQKHAKNTSFFYYISIIPSLKTRIKNYILIIKKTIKVKEILILIFFFLTEFDYDD